LKRRSRCRCAAAARLPEAAHCTPMSETPARPAQPRRPRGNRLQVVVRKRPLSGREAERGRRDVLDMQADAEGAWVIVHEPKTKVDLTAYIETHNFRFDGAFGEATTNRTLYAGSVAPLVSHLFAGRIATCFAYGATGAGKTHTMLGSPQEHGIYSLAANSIFERMEASNGAGGEGLVLRVSAFEIYGGKVFDLLHARKLCPVREDSKKRVHVVGLTQRHCHDIDHYASLLAASHDARQTAATMANGVSSRSHAVLQLALCRRAAARPAARGRRPPARREEEEEEFCEVGRMSFIDLAGTERGAATLSCHDKERQLEGAEINKSLLALKECIRGLDAGKSHVPFRGSKLTEVLRDSFVGDCHTVMIAAVGPSDDSVEQTLNTLRYAATVHDLSSSSVAPPPTPTLQLMPRRP